jgi:predicted transcriptional regulator
VCWMMIIPAILGFAQSAVSGYMQTKAQNDAALQQYSFQQQQQRLVNNAAVDQYNESIARQHIDEQRTAQGDFNQAQTNILQNQRAQATAIANASTAGITGTPLSLLFNDYQVSSGNVATNLQTAYKQLNENLFFNSDSLLRQAQSTMNQATPAPPYLAKFSVLPALLSGASSGFSAYANMKGSQPVNPSVGGNYGNYSSYGNAMGSTIINTTGIGIGQTTNGISGGLW